MIIRQTRRRCDDDLVKRRRQKPALRRPPGVDRRHEATSENLRDRHRQVSGVPPRRPSVDAIDVEERHRVGEMAPARRRVTHC